ncbi:MAG: hypothetical protein ACKVX7_19440 [Planctomycetota bacterium]
MTLVRLASLIGVALLVMIVNVALSFVYMVVLKMDAPVLHFGATVFSSRHLWICGCSS